MFGMPLFEASRKKTVLEGRKKDKGNSNLQDQEKFLTGDLENRYSFYITHRHTHPPPT